MKREDVYHIIFAVLIAVSCFLGGKIYEAKRIDTLVNMKVQAERLISNSRWTEMQKAFRNLGYNVRVFQPPPKVTKPDTTREK